MNLTRCLLATVVALFVLAPLAQASTLPPDQTPIEVQGPCGRPTCDQEFSCGARRITGTSCRSDNSCRGSEASHSGSCTVTCKTRVGSVLASSTTVTCTGYTGIEPEF